MKRIVSAVLLLVLCVGVLAACNKSNTPDGMKNAAADDAKFYLYVPEGWIEQTKLSSANSPSNDGANVLATSYLMEQAYTAESYWTEKARPEIESAFKEFTLLEEQCGDAVLGGIDGKRYVYTASLGGTVYQFMQFYVVQGEMVYTLTYTAKESVFATHLEDVESIRANFVLR